MEPLRHDPNPALDAHVTEVQKVLDLPREVNGIHWHPFGVYAAPLAPRTDSLGNTWSRRLHIWHPEAKPVGEASAYGVHTHSGTARSHVLTGTLHHHLYEFESDNAGDWQRACLGKAEGMARLLAHVWEPTEAGQTHTLPANQPHGVTKPAGFAVSLFEQQDGPTEQPFTTWQRQDMPAEQLEPKGPVEVGEVLQAARQVMATCLQN